MSIHDRNKLRKLRRHAGRLNRMIGDGSIQDVTPRGRSRLLRRVRDLYEGLCGVVSEITLRHILAASAVLVLGVSACGGGGGGPTGDADTDTGSDVAVDMDAGDLTDPAEEPVSDAVLDGDEDPVPDGEEDATPDGEDDPVLDGEEDAEPDTGTDAEMDPDADDAVDVGVDEGVSTITPSFATARRNPFSMVLGASYVGLPELADLDGDGDLDMMAGVGDITAGGIMYYENTGTAGSATFGSPDVGPFSITITGVFAAPALVDIDGDGDLDLFTGESDTYTGSIGFRRNTGTSTSPAFAAPVTNPFGISGLTDSFYFPELGDIDGDGDMDLFLGERDGDVLLLRNTGTSSSPAFAAPVTNPLGITAVTQIAAPALGDLDRDGDLDLIVGEEGGDLMYFQNTGTATSPAFATVVANPFGLTSVDQWAFPDLADMDADGDLDLYVGEYDGYMQYFENTAI
ncbi:MAG: VCBS repeat-containing protein [Deltaproteobacteria bacterium]|nr:VCBS repeat-containing protein [Deltaproteobacteria bacterium]